MDSLQDLQFDLFVVFLICKLNRFLHNNPNNSKIKNLVSQLLNTTNNLASRKISTLSKRCLE